MVGGELEQVKQTMCKDENGSRLCNREGEASARVPLVKLCFASASFVVGSTFNGCSQPSTSFGPFLCRLGPCRSSARHWQSKALPVTPDSPRELTLHQRAARGTRPPKNAL